MDTSACSRCLDVKQFGAKGDGVTDDTAAFRAALAEAGKVTGTVCVPAGTYLCGELQMPPHTGLVAEPTWAYRARSAAPSSS